MLFVVGSVEKRLVEEVRNNDTLIIVGETGSGKTTRKFCFCAPLFTVVVLDEVIDRSMLLSETFGCYYVIRP